MFEPPLQLCLPQKRLLRVPRDGNDVRLCKPRLCPGDASMLKLKASQGAAAAARSAQGIVACVRHCICRGSNEVESAKSRANHTAISENVVSSLALRPQPSLAKDPHPGYSCINPRLNLRASTSSLSSASLTSREVTSCGVSRVHRMLHSDVVCRLI